MNSIADPVIRIEYGEYTLEYNEHFNRWATYLGKDTLTRVEIKTKLDSLKDARQAADKHHASTHVFKRFTALVRDSYPPTYSRVAVTSRDGNEVWVTYQNVTSRRRKLVWSDVYVDSSENQTQIADIEALRKQASDLTAKAGVLEATLTPIPAP